jgi:hypothetical protein
MGKRSRQRAAPREKSAGPKTRKERARQRADAASRIAERQIKARPQAPWHPFPLTEIAIFVGIVLTIVGIVMSSDTGKGLIAAGVVLACIGGLETALREHLGGYRSHAGLLAGLAALTTLIIMTAVLKITVAVCAAIAIAVFGLVFPALRSAFIRKSGGRGVL